MRRLTFPLILAALSFNHTTWSAELADSYDPFTLGDSELSRFYVFDDADARQRRRAFKAGAAWSKSVT